MVPTGRVSASNRLLAGLPAKDRKALLARCDGVQLGFGEVLDEPGQRIGHVYFPIDSYVSLVTKAGGEASLEVGLVGDEGMDGVSLALGIDVSPLHALVQGAGPALRMSATAFRRDARIPGMDARSARVGVTAAASALQRQRLISYKSGVVTVLNRRGLEAASCPCYRINNNIYDQMLK